MAQAQKKTAVRKRRERKNIEHGSAHICSSFNNTIVTIADLNGNTISWASAGELGSATEAPESPLRLQLRWLLKLQQRQQWSMVSRLLKFS